MAKDHEEDEDIDDEDIEPTDDELEELEEDDDADKDKDPDALKDEDIEKDNDVKSLKDKLKKREAARVKERTARIQLTARAKKAEGNKKPIASPDTKKNNQGRKNGSDPLEKRIGNIEQIEAKRQFGYTHNLSPDETDLAFKFANGKPTKKTLEDPFFKAGLEGIRRDNKNSANTPGSSRRSAPFSDKPFSELTKEQKKAQFEGKIKSIKRS